MKFCAVHSSRALAVNCFAPFKVESSRLELLRKHRATTVEFEHKLNTANMAAWVSIVRPKWPCRVPVPEWRLVLFEGRSSNSLFPGCIWQLKR